MGRLTKSKSMKTTTENGDRVEIVIDLNELRLGEIVSEITEADRFVDAVKKREEQLEFDFNSRQEYQSELLKQTYR